MPVNEKNYISNDPFFSFVDLDPSHEFLVIACDGLWGYMKHEEVLEFIDNSFDSKKPLSDITENIVNEIIDYRSGKDNVSVIVVTLPYTIEKK